MESTINLPTMFRQAELRAASFDEGANTIDVIWTAGAVVRRVSWVDGEFDEELAVDTKSVRLDRLNAGAPFLNSHDSYDLRSVIGSVVPGTAVVRGGKGYATVQMSRRDDAAGIVQDIRDGVIRNVSVGYRTHAVERRERKDKVPLHRAIDWEPLEISAVAVPADAAAQIRTSSDAGDVHRCLVRRDPREEIDLRRIRMTMRQRRLQVAE
ncbi:MAG: HK97 family phage prohead protease [Devosia sp.]